MNGKRAKFLRRLVYKDQSLKQSRNYTITNTGTLVNTGLRKLYQDLKKAYRERRSNG